MASWTFTEDYGAQYPALAGSILNLLVFSDHTVTGTSFTGTLDVTATGAALATLGQIVNMTSIAVSGTVTNENNTLTVSLASSDTAAFTAGVAQSIPLIGGSITQNASLTIGTVVTTTDDPDEGPTKDQFNLNVTFAVGSHSVTIVSQVPMNDGFVSLTGTFTNVGIDLDDLNFLMGSMGSSSQWFPATELGPYASGSPAFELLSMALTLYITINPLTVTVSSVTVSVGITNIPLMGQKLYLDPLAVVVTVSSPTSNPTVTWGLEGDIVLCNYARPGDTNNPDFVFELQMSLTDFTISGELENPSNLPVNTMIQDLIGAGTNVGLPDTLTINCFDFDTQADKTTGSISSFSTDIAMSGGFGLFSDFDLESFAFSLVYTA